jgi:uncharacterized membrane protein YphA (DoxX/SURF4 family)
MIIGWHLLYEGIAKILIPGWTSAGYLENASWIFAGFFHWMASDAVVLKIVDMLNIGGLTLIGLCLLLGFMTRFAGIMGILLLSLYYISNPPFIGTSFGMPLEGHYLFIDKNLVEIAGLFVIIIFSAGRSYGLDRFLSVWKKSKTASAERSGPAEQDMAGERELVPVDNPNRRELFRFLTTVPVLGAFIYGTAKKYNWEKLYAVTGATIQLSDSRLKDLKGTVPKGKIKNFNVCRLMLGSNMISGSMHSRDLRYVRSLCKAYNTEKKVFETLILAEQAGIDTINLGKRSFPLVMKYKEIFGSKLQTMCQIHPTKDDIYSRAKEVIDNGVDMVQIQGNCCDWRVRDGEIDVIAKCIDYIKQQGCPAGLGAHSIQALIECDHAGIEPDFYFKTLHHDNYWSAHPQENRIAYTVDTKRSPNHNEFHDNMFCLFPEQTVEFFNRKNVPFVAFKVLAAGAIPPKDGFTYAFESGADFICVGMFDYQIVDDVNICLDVLSNLQNRQRGWMA